MMLRNKNKFTQQPNLNVPYYDYYYYYYYLLLYYYTVTTYFKKCHIINF